MVVVMVEDIREQVQDFLEMDLATLQMLLLKVLEMGVLADLLNMKDHLVVAEEQTLVTHGLGLVEATTEEMELITQETVEVFLAGEDL
jgi:hypothetical protein